MASPIGPSMYLAKKVHEAARDGMVDTISALFFNKSADEVKSALTTRVEEDGQQTSPFIIAARNGHENVVKHMLVEYHVDIEQTGTVKFDGFIIDGATALWCSAGAGHFPVVITLLAFGANVNHPTLSNSTPLRAACFDGRLDIVEYLIKNKADVHIPNKFKNTCLMIASYRGHCDVVTHLLENGANPNTHAQCGATALHFAAERGHLQIVRELSRFGAKMVFNNQNLTALMVAAECSRAEIVEFFISNGNCSRKDRIEALELLGASYANDKDYYDVDKAYHYMWLAMQERYSEENDILLKCVKHPVPAYENMAECCTVAELEDIKDDHNAVHMQALILRERILGANNSEIPHPIIFRGAVFADTAQFDRCTALWMHALRLRKQNDRSITKDILRFAQVFSQMIHVSIGVEFILAMEVYKCTLTELERDLQKIASASADEIDTLHEIHECNIHTALYLLVILTKVNCTKKQEHLLCTAVYQFTKLKLNLRKNAYTPLHMVVDDATVVDDFHVNDVVKFPSAVLTRLLVRCGADCNKIDCEGNTPLHTIVKYNKPISDFMTLHSIIMVLLEGGVHIDRCNKSGRTAMEASITGVAEIILRTQRDISLKCIAAKAVKQNGISYKNEIPSSLEEFVDIH